MPLRTDPIVLPDLTGLDSSGPRLLLLDCIDEDPDQPRTEFDPESLTELAATIRLRGVLQPISVRPHPATSGRWMLNFGSRRYRASRLAGRDVIPAFVDDAFDTYAQVIENEQREQLQPMDLALFVKRRRDMGETQTEIARLLGKSQAYVSMASALIDAPDWLMNAYRQGKCRGLTELSRLRHLHKTAPAEVENWCRETGGVSRAGLQRFLDSHAGKDRNASTATTSETPQPRMPGPVAIDKPPRHVSALPSLMALYEGRSVKLVVDECPPEPWHILVIDTFSSQLISVAASSLVLQGFESTAK